MTERPLNHGELDESAYREAETQFKLVSEALPSDKLERLAAEVVRRLAFRMPRQLDANHVADAQEIDTLCEALLSEHEEAGDRIILTARRDGVSDENIYLSYLAGAARQLGKMWERDEISFVEVTLASGRLYRIIRGLRHVIDPRSAQITNHRQVLFALVPGETHTLGIEMAADVFRRRGWDVDVSIGEGNDDVLARMDQTRFAVVVLIANSEARVEDVISMVLNMRITQPMMRIVLAGNLVEQVELAGELVGADAVLTDIRSAVTTLDDLIGGT